MLGHQKESSSTARSIVSFKNTILSKGLQLYSLSDGESLLGSLLLGESDLLLVLSGNGSGLLGNLELNVAVGGKVGGDSSVGSVSSSSSVHGSLGGNVGNLALLDIKTLGLGVGLKVVQERNDVVDGLLGPSSVVVSEVLAHGLSSGTSSVSSEGDDGGMVQASLHVLNGFKEVKSPAGSGSLVGVLVVGSQVIDSARSG